MSELASYQFEKLFTSLSLNGSSDYIDTGSSDHHFQSAFTAMAWVKKGNDTGGHNVIGTDDVSSGWSMVFTGGTTLRFISRGTSPSAVLDSNGTVQSGEWTHLAIVYDDDNKYLYINGDLDNGLAVTGTIGVSSNTLQIGRRTDGANYFNGNISDARVFDRALDAAEIRSIMHRKISASYNGLSGEWKLNDGSGSTVADSTENNSGTITGGTWMTGVKDKSVNANHGDIVGATKLAGVRGNAYSFDGVDDYIELTTITETSKGNDFSVSLWFNANTIVNDDVVNRHTLFCSLLDSSNDGVIIGVRDEAGTGDPGAIVAAIFDNEANPTSSRASTPSGFVSVGTWYHVVYVYQSSGQIGTMYVNGVMQTDGIGPGWGVTTKPKGTRIGWVTGSGSHDSHWNGEIDDVRVFDKALSHSEIKRVMNGFTPIT